ncbi:MAG: hypothetical protein Q9195_007597 [Heterodermia aff. obscurata]
MPASKRQRNSQQDDLEGILDNGKKALYRALRVSKGFERQKLGRRQKTAKEQKESVESLAQLKRDLQKLNLLAIGEIHLYKTLLKSKSVSTAPIFPAWVSKKVKQAQSNPDTANANVTARLFNSNPVRLALETILGGVYSVLDLSADDVPRRKKRLRAADYKAKPQNEGSEEQKEDQATKSQGQEHNPEQKLHQRLMLKPNLIDQDVMGSEDESEDYGAYDERLANSSNAESESDEAALSDDGSGGEMHGVSVGNALLRNYAGSPSLSPSASPSPSTSLSPSVPAPSIPHVAAPGKPTTSTTFLPTLNGGYWSGSENSDAGEVDDDGSLVRKQRKNRRGQQERRAIWEKKFGARARHIQKQELGAATSARDHGWDPKRGASEDKNRGRGRRSRGMKAGGRSKGGGGLRSGANKDPVNELKKRGKSAQPNSKVKAEAPLHPSWEAKKKAKEKTGNSVVAFQGKKVVFE